MSTDTTTGDADQPDIQYRILRKSGVPQGFECCECGRDAKRADAIDHLTWCSEHHHNDHS